MKKELFRILYVVFFVSISIVANASDVADATEKIKSLEAEMLRAKSALVTARKAELALKSNAPLPVDELQLVIPRFSKAPVIDGNVDADEWKKSVCLTPGTGASNIGQLLKARPSAIFNLGWDPENLYMAVRIPMRDGEMPSRLNRKPQWDSMACWETLGEFYIDHGGNGSIGLPCKYQFIGTATGNQWDREEQYTIGQNMVSWDGKWDFKQKLSADGKFWMGEFAVPRKTVYFPQPIKDGTRWKLGIAASLMHPWQWCGLYGWPITATFRDEAPSISLDGIEQGLTTKRATGNLTILNTTSKRIEATAVVQISQGKDIPVNKEFPLTLAPGETFTQRIDEDASSAKDNSGYIYLIKVISGDSSLFTFKRSFAFNDPMNTEGLKVETKKEAFPLTCGYYPLSNIVNTSVDIYDLAFKDKIKSANISVKNADNKVVSTEIVTDFPYGVGSTRMNMPANLTPGKYTVTAQIFDTDNKELASNQGSFIRKDHAKEFPWLGNTVGCDDIVPRIFQPLSYEKGIIKAYNKSISLNGSALPARIEAAGMELLASPVYMRGISGGTAFIMKPADKEPHKGKISKTNVIFSGSSVGGPVSADVSYRLDYDGTARIELTIAPSVKGKSANIDNLQLVIPFKGESATHYMSVGNSMRQSNRAGKLPGAGTIGTVWKSSDVPGQNMTVGSFVPIVHLGNLNSGITWFADSDQGWWPSNKKPAIEIIRCKDGTVELVCNLASEAVELSSPRKIVFGLCTVPVRAVTPYRTTAHTIGFGYIQESGRWDPKKTPGSVYARVYPDDPSKMRKWVDDLHANGHLEKCYVENTSADYWSQEYEYFAPEWNSPFTKTAADNKLYWTEKFIRDCEIDGYYFDNVFTRLYTDPTVTSAYLLPDGRIQPGYDLWTGRDYFRRMRVIFEKYRNPTAMVIHNTDFQFAPICGYADLVMGGENPTPIPGGPDFMDMWPREWMDVMYNQYLWGYSLSHLYHYGWDAFKDDLGEYDKKAAWKGHRTAMATMINHGVEFFSGIEYNAYDMPAYKMFKSLPGEMEFLPSWKTKDLIKCDNPNIDVAIYRKSDALLILVTNYGKNNAQNLQISFDFPKLLPVSKELIRGRELFDLEGITDTFGILDPGGPRAGATIHPAKLRVDVAAHDWRGFILLNSVPAQGIGF